MNASLLAALASPGSGAKSRRKGKENLLQVRQSDRGTSSTRLSREDVGGDATKGRTAPSFTVPLNPSTPGRMENLRVLIEEGKKAAAEGRLAAALRKYETAMVTLPEAYKPRLRNKIARLEAQLDAEEDGAPGTPARVATASRDVGGEGAEKCPGPLDLLHIAVQDVAAAAEASGRNTSALSTFSPRRSSPLVRGLPPCTRVLSSVPDAGEPSVAPCDPRDEDEDDVEGRNETDNDVRRLGASLGSRLTVAGTGQVALDKYDDDDNDERLKSAQIAPGSSSRHDASRLGAVWPMMPGGSREENRQVGDDRGSELGAAEDSVEYDEISEEQSVDKQERLRAINKGLSDKLERQVVTIMNEASSEELTSLHGIGPRRAQLILQTRVVTPFKTLADLTRIGMYPKQIERMGKHNMLECLDVFPTSKGSVSPPSNNSTA